MAFEGQTGDWTREVGDRDGRGVGKDTYKEQGKSASTSLVILRESWKGGKTKEGDKNLCKASSRGQARIRSLIWGNTRVDGLSDVVGRGSNR